MADIISCKEKQIVGRMKIIIIIMRMEIGYTIRSGKVKVIHNRSIG